jgi:hypothetical protein
MNSQPNSKTRISIEICKIEDLISQTLTKIEGAKQKSREITFTATNGKSWVMNHPQDCCEYVDLEDVCGDIKDLIGSPILIAECITSRENPPNITINLADQDSFTWTFYKLATIKGSVTFRWYGESNGYYSEEVDFYEVHKGK